MKLEAAKHLGVTPQRVRELAEAGKLEAIRAEGVWLIGADSLARRVLLGELGVAASSARPWSQPIAWAAMRALDDDEALLSHLDRKARYRLRRRLDDRDPARLLSAVRNRARVDRASVHPSRVARLRDLMVPSRFIAHIAESVPQPSWLCRPTRERIRSNPVLRRSALQRLPTWASLTSRTCRVTSSGCSSVIQWLPPSSSMNCRSGT